MPVPMDIDGIMWGSERQGALSDSLGPHMTYRPVDPGNVTCFCGLLSEQSERARDQCGASPAGFLEVENSLARRGAANAPWTATTFNSGGSLLRYPELAAWEMLWTDSLRETYAAIYKTVKNGRSRRYRWAGTSGTTILSIRFTARNRTFMSSRNYSDFIKIVMYNNCGGEADGDVCRQYRLRHFMEISRNRA